MVSASSHHFRYVWLLPYYQKLMPLKNYTIISGEYNIYATGYENTCGFKKHNAGIGPKNSVVKYSKTKCRQAFSADSIPRWGTRRARPLAGTSEGRALRCSRLNSVSWCGARP